MGQLIYYEFKWHDVYHWLSHIQIARWSLEPVGLGFCDSVNYLDLLCFIAGDVSMLSWLFFKQMVSFKVVTGNMGVSPNSLSASKQPQTCLLLMGSEAKRLHQATDISTSLWCRPGWKRMKAVVPTCLLLEGTKTSTCTISYYLILFKEHFINIFYSPVTNWWLLIKRDNAYQLIFLHWLKPSFH